MIEWIVSSSALVAVVILLRALLKGKIGLRLQYALWGLALLRLLVPVSFGSTAISVQNALPTEAKTIPETVTLNGQVELHTTDGQTYGYTLPAQRTELETQRQLLRDSGELKSEGGHTNELTLRSVLRYLWFAGMAAVAMCLFGSNLRFALRLRKTRKLLREETLPVYLTEEADTPCLFGLFCPAVYVTPEAAEEEGRLRHVIEHELTHYRHADHLWSLLRGLCLILHWYNPLVWWGAILARRDCELACDEATIARLGEEERAAYGRTLIYMTCLKRPAILVTATTMTGSKGSIKERIALIVKKPRTAVITLVAVLLAAAVAVGCTFTGGKTPETEVPATEAPAATPTANAILTPTPGVLPMEAADEEFLDLARPLMEDYCRKTGWLCLEEGTVLRNGDGTSLDVVYPTIGKRYSVAVSFIKGEDGSWSPADPAGARLIENRERGFANLVFETEDRDLPVPVIEAAMEAAQLQLDYYERNIGYVFDEARLAGITFIDTGTAGLTEAVNMYLLEYRFLPAEDQEIMLTGGMTMEDGCLTEWGSAGQPYLLMLVEDKEDGQHWSKICTVNTDTITVDYGTPEMLEKYGNAYTAAAMELWEEFGSLQSTKNVCDLAVYSPSSSPLGIGQDWAQAFVQRLTQVPEDDPCYCRAAEVRSCELYAESLLSGPKSFVYTMEFACDPADRNACMGHIGDGFGAGMDTEHPDWLRFGWFVVLEGREDGSWTCVETGTGGYGGWGYLNVGWNAEDLLEKMVTEQVGGEDALMLLPLIDWHEFDRLRGFDSETWDTLWRKLYEACVGEGRIYDQHHSLRWSDVFAYDQVYRDMYVILGFLHADGAYAEGLATILSRQYAYDPVLFEQSLSFFPEKQQEEIRMNLEATPYSEVYGYWMEFFDAEGQPISAGDGWYHLTAGSRIRLTWTGEVPEGVRLLFTPAGTEAYDQTRLLIQRSLREEDRKRGEVSFTVSELDELEGHGQLFGELDYGRVLRRGSDYNVLYDPEVDSITLNRQDITLSRIGESYTLLAIVTPAGTGLKVIWTSDDPEVATVDENGMVTAVDHGTTVVRASAGGVAAECTVRVSASATGQNENEQPVNDDLQSGIEKKTETLLLNRVGIILTGRGETYTFQSFFTPKDSDAPLRWTSSDPTVATVDASGTVTAVADGKAVIRAETERVFAECIVRVEFLGSEDSESVIAVLHIYDGPTREKMEPKGVRRVILDGSNSDEAETINEIKSIIDGIRFWTDDEMADRLEFYFDGDIVFSDREFVYYFSFDKRTVFYNRYFSTISQKDMEYIRSIAGE